MAAVRVRQRAEDLPELELVALRKLLLSHDRCLAIYPGLPVYSDDHGRFPLERIRYDLHHTFRSAITRYDARRT
jgi:hypothetical protein